VAKHRYEACPTEHSDGAFLVGVDDYGVARLVAQKRHDAILAVAGVLHRTFVATDNECHGYSMNRG
jgi:hypothetical protein